MAPEGHCLGVLPTMHCNPKVKHKTALSVLGLN